MLVDEHIALLGPLISILRILSRWVLWVLLGRLGSLLLLSLPTILT